MEGPVTGSKRTKEERARDLEEIARLYLAGLRQWEIAAKFGVTQQQISYDLKTIRREWLKRAAVHFDAAMAEELARLDRLEQEYWEGWRRSIAIRRKKRERQTERRIGEGDQARAVRFAEKVSEEEEGVGNPAFLAGVNRCVEQRCKLMGLTPETPGGNGAGGSGGGDAPNAPGKLRLSYMELTPAEGQTVNDILAEVGVVGYGDANGA